MPGGKQNAARGVLRSSAAVGAAVVLAISAFVAQSPQLVAAAGLGCVTPGSAGPAATLTGVVNSYYPATASAAVGATSISLGPALAAGSLTAIAYGDGSTGRGFTAGPSLDLSTATQLQVFGPTAQQQLVLITCIGQYSRNTRTYDHRLVVFSRLLPGAA